MGSHRSRPESEILGEAIRLRRLQCRLSLEDLAASVDATKATVWGWETGRTLPSLETLVRVARALHTKPSLLAQALDELV